MEKKPKRLGGCLRSAFWLFVFGVGLLACDMYNAARSRDRAPQAMVAITWEASSPPPTSPPTPTLSPTPLPTVPSSTVANRGANLRSGPSTDYPVVGGAKQGEQLTIVAKSESGDWYQLASGAWIAGFLVDRPPNDLSVAQAPPAPTRPPGPTAVASSRSTSGGDNNSTPFECNGGCAEPPAGANCVIKGNVNSSGDRIFHSPGQRDYEKTDIKPEEGDRWFCTAQEAVAAGFRAAKR